MNKINMNNNKIVLDVNCNDDIDFNEFSCEEIICNINKNIKVFISDINTNIKKYEFNISENSDIEINKFNNNNISSEININLLKNSKINLIISNLTTDENIININVSHKGNNSYSKCINNGIVKEGTLKFYVNGIVEKGSLNCSVLQESKIITKNVKTSTIKPVLIINEAVEQANHQASIGYYNEDEIFYLESRGIEKEKAIDLINRGLLTNNFKYKDKIEKFI